MLKYLIIQLDDSSVSFCHYDNDKSNPHLIPLDSLKDAIFWSMKENLTLQFLYPGYEIPAEYKNEINKTFHADIVSSSCDDDELRRNADVIIFDLYDGINSYQYDYSQAYVFRATLSEHIDNVENLTSIFPGVNRVNIITTDVLSFKKEDVERYVQYLDTLAYGIAEEYKKEHIIQLNILTDRILLDGMNNCNAGDEIIALCPDGNFYVCPAFYSDKENSFAIGNISFGVNIKNPQLYKLRHAPICRVCDAYQCRRCTWMNCKSTLEVNTPSHEQCLVAHLERNASRKLLSLIREIGEFMPNKDIPKINYLDPFQLIIKND